MDTVVDEGAEFEIPSAKDDHPFAPGLYGHKASWGLEVRYATDKGEAFAPKAYALFREHVGARVGGAAKAQRQTRVRR